MKINIYAYDENKYFKLNNCSTYKDRNIEYNLYKRYKTACLFTFYLHFEKYLINFGCKILSFIKTVT